MIIAEKTLPNTEEEPLQKNKRKTAKHPQKSEKAEIQQRNNKNHKTAAASAEKELAWRWAAINASARKTHTPASKIYSWARVGHAPVHAGRMEVGTVAERCGEAEEHGGMDRLRVGFQEIDRSEFEKPKFINFKK
jgi:hypothetical protein